MEAVGDQADGEAIVGAMELLAEFGEVLKGLDPFDAASTDKALHGFAAAKGVKPRTSS